VFEGGRRDGLVADGVAEGFEEDGEDYVHWLSPF